jgi:hypothetical protein
MRDIDSLEIAISFSYEDSSQWGINNARVTAVIKDHVSSMCEGDAMQDNPTNYIEYSTTGFTISCRCVAAKKSV